jgi:hypothetical protein
MLADALTRQSGVEGWQVEAVNDPTPSEDNTRILFETRIKAPPGWTIVSAEDGSVRPARVPEGLTFGFGATH